MEKLESKVSKYLSEICSYMQSIDEASCHERKIPVHVAKVIKIHQDKDVVKLNLLLSVKCDFDLNKRMDFREFNNRLTVSEIRNQQQEFYSLHERYNKIHHSEQVSPPIPNEGPPLHTLNLIVSFGYR
jgi:hypothetical protein